MGFLGCPQTRKALVLQSAHLADVQECTSGEEIDEEFVSGREEGIIGSVYEEDM